MDKKENVFKEQDHPLKNTDHAFVQVGKDGEPVIPKQTEDIQQEHGNPEKPGTLEHR